MCGFGKEKIGKEIERSANEKKSWAAAALRERGGEVTI